MADFSTLRESVDRVHAHIERKERQRQGYSIYGPGQGQSPPFAPSPEELQAATDMTSYSDRSSMAEGIALRDFSTTFPAVEKRHYMAGETVVIQGIRKYDTLKLLVDNGDVIPIPDESTRYTKVDHDSAIGAMLKKLRQQGTISAEEYEDKLTNAVYEPERMMVHLGDGTKYTVEKLQEEIARVSELDDIRGRWLRARERRRP